MLYSMLRRAVGGCVGGRVGKRDEGRGTRRREEGRGGRKRVRFFFVPPFLSRLFVFLALGSLFPSFCRSSKQKKRRPRRAVETASGSTAETSRHHHHSHSKGTARGETGEPLSLPRPRTTSPGSKKNSRQQNTTFSYLICSLSAASQSEVKPARARETSAAWASLDTLASSGLTCEGVESEWRKRERVSGGRERVEPRKASVCFF